MTFLRYAITCKCIFNTRMTRENRAQLQTDPSLIHYRLSIHTIRDGKTSVCKLRFDRYTGLDKLSLLITPCQTV